ncbi:MAG: DUF2905 domain-containing protein [Acidobacteriota bacterium]
MRQAGNFLVALGVFLIILGYLLRTGLRLPGLGKLPGDIVIQKGHFTIYLPLATSLLLSLLVSLIIFLIFRLTGKN